MSWIVLKHPERLEELQDLCTELDRVSALKRGLRCTDSIGDICLIPDRDVMYVYEDSPQDCVKVAEAYIRGFYAGAAEQLRDVHGI